MVDRNCQRFIQIYEQVVWAGLIVNHLWGDKTASVDCTKSKFIAQVIAMC